MASLVEQPIRLRSHEGEWAVRYEAERAALERAIGERAIGGIHHVGSTAIPGVDAEPVIDILVGTENLSSSQTCVEPLAELGYVFELHRTAEAHSLCKPHPQQRTHDLHLVPVGSEHYEQMLAFREFLRADLQTAIGYAAMKRDLAERHGGDRQGYTVGKASLIQAVLARL